VAFWIRVKRPEHMCLGRTHYRVTSLNVPWPFDRQTERYVEIVMEGEVDLVEAVGEGVRSSAIGQTSNVRRHHTPLQLFRLPADPTRSG
jgi:hypothetical protein